MQKVSNPNQFYGLLGAQMSTPDAATRVRQRIARLLDDRGFTQRSLAKALGHGDQWASNLLSGKSQLAWDDYDKVAKFLRIPPGELTRVSDESWELTPTEMRLLRAVRMLPQALRDHLVIQVETTIGNLPDEIETLMDLRSMTDETRQHAQSVIRSLARGPVPRPAALDGRQLVSEGQAAIVRRRKRREKQAPQE